MDTQNVLYLVKYLVVENKWTCGDATAQKNNKVMHSHDATAPQAEEPQESLSAWCAEPEPEYTIPCTKTAHRENDTATGNIINGWWLCHLLPVHLRWCQINSVLSLWERWRFHFERGKLSIYHLSKQGGRVSQFSSIMAIGVTSVSFSPKRRNSVRDISNTQWWQTACMTVTAPFFLNPLPTFVQL